MTLCILMVTLSLGDQHRHHHHHQRHRGLGLSALFTYMAISTLVRSMQIFNTYSSFAIFLFMDATPLCLLLTF